MAHRRYFELMDDSWRADAACRSTDPDLFFPIGTTGPAVEQIANAKAICRNCMAQLAYLEYALAINEDHGIWGGATEDERRKIYKIRARTMRAAQE